MVCLSPLSFGEGLGVRLTYSSLSFGEGLGVRSDVFVFSNCPILDANCYSPHVILGKINTAENKPDARRVQSRHRARMAGAAG